MRRWIVIALKVPSREVWHISAHKTVEDSQKALAEHWRQGFNTHRDEIEIPE